MLRQSATFTHSFNEYEPIIFKSQIPALRLVTRQCPIFMLFAGNDQWAPVNHMTDISKLQTANVLPKNNISMTYRPSLQHDYVSHDGMSTEVVDWCFQSILTTTTTGTLTDYNRSMDGAFVKEAEDEVLTMRSRL
jgi:hypothetical protein